MRILLPPSEGKAIGGREPSLAETGFGDGPLANHRSRLCRQVRLIAAGPRADAVRAFALPAAVTRAALRANEAVLSSPTTSALNRYAGVVYDGLDVPTLSRAQRRHADATILVFSGLFGVVRGDEAIPHYRVPACAVLAGIGGAGASWRPILSAAMPDLLGDGLVVDLRSGNYASMWRPGRDIAERVVAVRMLSRRPDGQLAVVSQFSKYGKGRLTRALIMAQAARRRIRTAQDIAQLWVTSAGGEADVRRHRGHVQLDLVTPDSRRPSFGVAEQA